MITLIPSDKLGIFVSINGEGTIAHMVKSLVITHVTDILQGEEPWINLTAACEFPKPWKEFPKNISYFKVFNRAVSPKKPLKEYAGRYGNMLYGNLTVSLDKKNNQLKLVYGKLSFRMYPTTTAEELYIESEEKTWMIQNFKVTFTFSGRDSKADTITVPFAMDEEPPVFKRGLLFKMASHSPTGPIRCEKTSECPLSSTGTLLYSQANLKFLIIICTVLIQLHF